MLNKSNDSASFKSPEHVNLNNKTSTSSLTRSPSLLNKNSSSSSMSSFQPLKNSINDIKQVVKKKERIIIDDTRCYNCKTPYDTKLTNAKHRKVTDSCNHSICFLCLTKEMPCLLCEHLKEQENDDKLFSNPKIIPDTQPSLKIIQDTQPAVKVIKDTQPAKKIIQDSDYEDDFIVKSPVLTNKTNKNQNLDEDDFDDDLIKPLKIKNSEKIFEFGAKLSKEFKVPSNKINVVESKVIISPPQITSTAVNFNKQNDFLILGDSDDDIFDDEDHLVCLNNNKTTPTKPKSSAIVINEDDDDICEIDFEELAKNSNKSKNNFQSSNNNNNYSKTNNYNNSNSFNNNNSYNNIKNSNNNNNDCDNEPNSNNPLANNKLKLKYGVDIPDINYYEKIKWLFDDIKDCSPYYRSLDYPHSDNMLSAFRNLFGLKQFRPQQFESVNAALLSHNVFVLMPTGGGKSLIYQLPAVVSGGVTFVVSPLKSLIIDQVQKLNALGLNACHLLSDGKNENQETGQSENVYQDLCRKEPTLKLVYVTPEKLNCSGKLGNIITNLYSRNMLARLVIDEAHCVSFLICLF